MQIGSRYRERLLDEVDTSGKPVVQSYPSPLGYYRQYNSGTLVFEQPLFFTGYQTVPRYQRTWDEIHPGPPWRGGGPFSSIRVEYPRFAEQGRGVYRRTVGSTVFEYEGAFYCPDVSHDYLDAGILSNTGYSGDHDQSLLPDLDAYGPSVYAALRPQLSMANMSVAMLEAKDAIGATRTSAKHLSDLYQHQFLKRVPIKGFSGRGYDYSSHPFMDPKWLAEEYLNEVFGWFPLIKDLQDIRKADLLGQQFMDDLSRKNNQWEKRTRTIEDTEGTWTQDYVQFGYFGCQPLGHLMDNVFPTKIFETTHKTVSRVWAEGKWKYYLPEFDTLLPKYSDKWTGVQREMQLYGLRINPLVLYKATPWTWLIDWFTGLGNLIARLQDAGLDGIVSKDVYLMMHRHTLMNSNHTLIGADGGPVSFTWSRTFETKLRTGADSPYGFGLSWNGLSPRQLAILAALGITRKGGDRTL